MKKVLLLSIIGFLVVGSFTASIVIAQADESFTVLPDGRVVMMINGQRQELNAFLAPVGSIQAYVGDVAPEGWLLCDGASYSTTQYSNLYALIGTHYGAGTNGFNVPDLRGRFLRGTDLGAGRDDDANQRNLHSGTVVGDQVGTFQGDSIVSHNHAIQMVVDPAPNGSSGWNPAPVNADNANSGYGIHAWTSTTGSGETRPENMAVNFIIKY